MTCSLIAIVHFFSFCVGTRFGNHWAGDARHVCYPLFLQSVMPERLEATSKLAKALLDVQLADFVFQPTILVAFVTDLCMHTTNVALAVVAV